ncbi:MAG: hypothetical protein GWN84_18465 [Gammaproteobacteria bacterium]|nr:hypothetical protein [Gammaproteobacteria bacterium]NIR84817.1 hypothetical protein [Gammaproteobacteria bacterium]NIR91531.1 hypothetical protein [Gammaproteobacteria bacterium]NIU05864.1 hypothetical protein [Gammaproteobacteria bacterium]NIV76719.1 hypothetical protein [Gammaproteobacteria bacterium]
MDLPSDLLPAALHWMGHLIFWSIVGLTLWRARHTWATLRHPHVLFGGCVAVLILWQIKGAVPPAPPVHLLGATLLTLVCGWRFALVGLCAVLAGHTLNGAAGWASFGVNGLMSVALPVFVSFWLAHLVRRRLPANLFVYVFIAGFAGAAAAMGVVGLASGALLAGASPLDWSAVVHGHLTSYLLLLFPEAFLTGMVLTLLVVFYPDWVATYDARYEGRA